MSVSGMAVGRRGHVVIYGGFGYGNTGNDATLAVTLDALRERLPQTRYTVVATAPDVVTARHDVPSVPTRLAHRKVLNRRDPIAKLVREFDRWEQARELLATADCLLIPGTGLFDDYAVSTMQHAYPLWQWCRAARRMGVPVKFVSVGAGPVERPWSRRLFRLSAAMADHRSYRDEASRTFMRDVLRIDTAHDAVTPDLVFGMNVAAPPLRSGPPKIVGIGPMSFHSWRGVHDEADDVYYGYMDKLAAFCVDLLGQGVQLRILQGDPHDAPALEDLRSRLLKAAPRHADAVSLPKVVTLGDVIEEVGKTDAVVATRFHTIVGALLCGRPAVSLGYAHKNSAVMHEFGVGQYCQNIRDFDPDILRRHFASAVAEGQANHPRLLAASARLRQHVNGHFARIAAEIAQLAGSAEAGGVNRGSRTSPALGPAA